LGYIARCVGTTLTQAAGGANRFAHALRSLVFRRIRLRLTLTESDAKVFDERSEASDEAGSDSLAEADDRRVELGGLEHTLWREH